MNIRYFTRILLSKSLCFLVHFYAATLNLRSLACSIDLGRGFYSRCIAWVILTFLTRGDIFNCCGGRFFRLMMQELRLLSISWVFPFQRLLTLGVHCFLLWGNVVHIADANVFFSSRERRLLIILTSSGWLLRLQSYFIVLLFYDTAKLIIFIKVVRLRYCMNYLIQVRHVAAKSLIWLNLVIHRLSGRCCSIFFD